MKTYKKQDLFYCICKDKTVDVILGSQNFNYARYKYLIKDYPKSKYNYIKLD